MLKPKLNYSILLPAPSSLLFAPLAGLFGLSRLFGLFGNTVPSYGTKESSGRCPVGARPAGTQLLCQLYQYEVQLDTGLSASCNNPHSL